MEKKSENINEKLKVFNAVVILRREGKGGRKRGIMRRIELVGENYYMYGMIRGDENQLSVILL